MWKRTLSFLATFRCCREGVPEGNVWTYKQYIETDYHQSPRKTLYRWGEMAMDSLEAEIEPDLDQECRDLFSGGPKGGSHMELCYGSVIIDDIKLAQFFNDKRSKIDYMTRRKLE